MRTAVTELGFFEGTGVFEVEFNALKMLDRGWLVKSSLQGHHLTNALVFLGPDGAASGGD